MDFTFNEVREVCRQIRERSKNGDRPLETGNQSPEDVVALLCSLHEAGCSLLRMGYLLLAGGRVVARLRTDAEWDEWMEQGSAKPAGGAA
jgi:hypothetical protein